MKLSPSFLLIGTAQVLGLCHEKRWRMLPENSSPLSGGAVFDRTGQLQQDEEHTMNKGQSKTACVRMTGPDVRMDVIGDNYYNPANPLPVRCLHCTFPDIDFVPQPYLLTKPDPFSSNQSASRKVRHGRKETGKIRTENKPPDGERSFG